MPRKLPATITFDEAEDEVMFTQAALKADPDAEDLLPMTGAWLGTIDMGRPADRAAWQAVANADAARVIANGRLDLTCTAFGDELYLAVRKDRTSSEWRQFFAAAVSVFVRQALARQVATVRSWLQGSTHPVLENHRAELARWSTKADEALVATRGTALVRGTAHQAREEMAEDLTRERDGLYVALVQRAEERRLPRDWPSLFFRVKPRATTVTEEEPEPAPQTP
jgi:hypothetical protein